MLADPSLIRQAPQAAARREATPEDRTFVATASYSLPSFTTLGTLAAAAQIPPVLMALRTEGRAAAGDGGGGVYVWQSAAPTVPSRFYVTDTGPRGGYWVLDGDEQRPEVAGAFGGALGADPATDDRAAFADLFSFLATKYGGGTVRLGNRRHRIATTLRTVPYLRIECNPGCTFDPRERAVDPFDVRDQPGFVLDAGASLEIEHHNTWERFSVSRPGLSPVSDLAGGLARQAALVSAGDLIVRSTSGTYARRGVMLRDMCIWGGARCIYFNNMPGVKLENLWGDGDTFIYIENAGEGVNIRGVKQKNTITNGSASIVTIGITAIGDNGSGQLRITAASDVVAAGLTTGQRIASDRISGVSGQRWTATVVSTTEVDLLDVAWPGPTLLSGADFSFQVGAASAVTALLDDAGNLRVQTAVSMPFQVGQYALISLGGVVGEGSYTVLTRTSATDFTLNVAATAPMLAATLADCELVAMPGNRTGWGLYAFNVDGAFVEGTSKGGNGAYIDATNWTFNWSHEGGVVGELDRYDPSKRALKLAGTTTRFAMFGGALKSCGIGCEIDLATPKDISFHGVEFEGSVYCIDVVDGGAAFFDARKRGSGIINQQAAADGSDFYAGEFGPTDVAGTSTQKAKVFFHRAQGSTQNTREQVVGTEITKAWVSGTATETHRIGSDGVVFAMPPTLPVSTVALLPTGAAGRIAFASDGRKNGEGAGAGTGVMVFHDGTAWRACDTGATVAA